MTCDVDIVDVDAVIDAAADELARPAATMVEAVETLLDPAGLTPGAGFDWVGASYTVKQIGQGASVADDTVTEMVTKGRWRRGQPT